MPHRVPGSFHSHTVILVVVNYDSSSHQSALGQTDGSVAVHSEPTAPPTTTTYIQQSYTFKDTLTMTQLAGAVSLIVRPGRGLNHQPSEHRPTRSINWATVIFALLDAKITKLFLHFKPIQWFSFLVYNVYYRCNCCCRLYLEGYFHRLLTDLDKLPARLT